MANPVLNATFETYNRTCIYVNLARFNPKSGLDFLNSVTKMPVLQLKANFFFLIKNEIEKKNISRIIVS